MYILVYNFIDVIKLIIYNMFMYNNMYFDCVFNLFFCYSGN